jgi:hypothetical protein
MQKYDQIAEAEVAYLTWISHTFSEQIAHSAR